MAKLEHNSRKATHHGNKTTSSHLTPRSARFRRSEASQRSISFASVEYLIPDNFADLTGSAPSPIDGSTTAGLTHIWPLKTDYYTASLPIWMDEVADADAWRTEFASPEAKEVVGALGAWIYCFRKPIDEQGYEEVKMMLKAIAKVIENACGYSWDGTCLAVATPQGITPHLEKEFEEWEESCRDHGFEYIDSEAKGRNEFGEAVGIARIREALETTDWTGDDDLDELDALGDELGDEDGLQFSDSFAAEEAEMGLELLGLKSAIAGGGRVARVQRAG